MSGGSWIPATAGFVGSGLFLYVLDKILPHLHPGLPMKDAKGIHTSWQHSALLLLAITLHNLPEDLAVGIAFGAGAAHIDGASMGGAIALAIGIKNFQEGTAVAMPLQREELGRFKCFWHGQLSGAVEPVAGVIGAWALIAMRPILPYASPSRPVP